MNLNTKYPRILVISNNCFSKTDSNGRTLGNFFMGWPKERLAQFYIQNAYPDLDVCENYFRVTDSQALKSIFGKKRGGRVKKSDAVSDTVSNSAVSTNKTKRNALTMILRNIVWKIGFWKKCGFDLWVDEFCPQAVLLQAGDNSFMFALARKTAEKYKAPLFIYNSEGYYFKNFDYFGAKGIAHLLYPIFRVGFCREFRRTQKHTAFNFYICDGLKKAYDEEFDTPSVVLYTSSGVVPLEKATPHNGFTVSYLGNLGVGRHEGLIEIANALQDISENYYLNVYGKISNEAVKTAFDNCKGIRYQGFVSYDGVIEVMKNSDLLVHTESFSDFYKEDLKFAFSTKIADSLASGRCFLLYAPNTVECYKYLQQNQLAYTISSSDKLKETLSLLASNQEARGKYTENALKAVESNHSIKNNRIRFADIICKISNEDNNGCAG